MAEVLPEHGQDQDTAYGTIHFILILTGGSSCFLVLLIIAGLACHPVSRSSLDRLSFRIMVYALLASLLYSISAAIIDRLPSEDTCPGMLWLANTSLLLSAFLLFCVGLNLQLVMIHGIQGQKMEKYYIACSFILAVAISIPPLATKNYRISPTGHCRRVPLTYQLTTRHLWIVLAILGDLVTFTSMLIHMMKLKVFDASPPPTRTRTCQSILAGYRKPLGPTQYRTIVLRIAMYPLASFVLLSIGTSGSVYVSVRGGEYVSSKVHTIFIMTTVAYGTRPLVYACIALFDPSLIRATKALYRHYRTSGGTIPSASDIPPLVWRSELERGETNTESTNGERDLELEVFTRQI